MGSYFNRQMYLGNMKKKLKKPYPTHLLFIIQEAKINLGKKDVNIPTKANFLNILIKRNGEIPLYGNQHQLHGVGV